MPPHAILVVEDDAVIRDMLTQILLGAGYEVATAVDGQEAIKQFNARRFDLILTDLIMPEKDGTEVIVELRKKQPTIPVVAMSGGGMYHRGEYLKLARMFGAHGLLEKPFSQEQLLSTIRVLLPAEPPEHGGGKPVVGSGNGSG